MTRIDSSGARELAKEASREVPKRLRSRLKRGLAPFSAAEDAPAYLRDNQFIKEYYRVNFDTRDTLRSLFRIHNESGNIWSHLVGDSHQRSCFGSALRNRLSPKHVEYQRYACAGFLIFAWLTLHALLARPAPLALAELKLGELEHSLQQQGCSLGELWQSGRPSFNFGWDTTAPSICLQERLNQRFGNNSRCNPPSVGRPLNICYLNNVHGLRECILHSRQYSNAWGRVVKDSD